MAQLETRIGMPLAEWMRLYDEQGAFELIDGEIIPVHPPKFGHSKRSNRLAYAMNSVALSEEIGEAFVETAFVLPDTDAADWVKGSRIPDVMFIAADRLANYEETDDETDDSPLRLVPDLVVEIVSPNDQYSDVKKKAERYLQDGVKAVWIVDQERKAVEVHTLGSKTITNLSENDTLSGGDVIPGFELPIKELFA